MNIKYLNRIFSFFILSIACVRTPSMAGSEHSGGADYQIELRAWFTSDQLDKPIQACIQSSPDFGYDSPTLRKMVVESFDKWVSYANKIGVFERSGVPPRWEGGYPNCTGYRIASHLEMHERCNGTEDLTIYFGVTTPEIASRKKKYSFPFGFSELLGPVDMEHHQAEWSKGMIWIAPPRSVDKTYQSPIWTNYEGAPLEMLLLHEMGHVFGNEHTPRTIMDSYIAHVLDEKTQLTHANRPRVRFDPLLLGIDGFQFLVYRTDLNFNLPLTIKNEEMPFGYQRLTGKMLSSSEFSATISRIAAPVSNHHLERAASPLETIETLGDLNIQITTASLETRLVFKPISILNHSANYQAFNSACWNHFPKNRYTILGKLIRPGGISSLYVLNLNDDQNWVDLSDIKIPSSDCFCASSHLWGESCPLLQVDFEKLRSDKK